MVLVVLVFRSGELAGRVLASCNHLLLRLVLQDLRWPTLSFFFFGRDLLLDLFLVNPIRHAVDQGVHGCRLLIVE